VDKIFLNTFTNINNNLLQINHQVTRFEINIVQHVTGIIPIQSVPITTKVVSSNPAHGEVYSIQHYVIKFVSDLQKVGGFLRILRFPPSYKI
jgi:hypothetical protein